MYLRIKCGLHKAFLQERHAVIGSKTKHAVIVSHILREVRKEKE